MHRLSAYDGLFVEAVSIPVRGERCIGNGICNLADQKSVSIPVRGERCIDLEEGYAECLAGFNPRKG